MVLSAKLVVDDVDHGSWWFLVRDVWWFMPCVLVGPGSARDSQGQALLCKGFTAEVPCGWDEAWAGLVALGQDTS